MKVKLKRHLEEVSAGNQLSNRSLCVVKTFLGPHTETQAQTGSPRRLGSPRHRLDEAYHIDMRHFGASECARPSNCQLCPMVAVIDFGCIQQQGQGPVGYWQVCPFATGSRATDCANSSRPLLRLAVSSDGSGAMASAWNAAHNYLEANLLKAI